MTGQGPYSWQVDSQGSPTFSTGCPLLPVTAHTQRVTSLLSVSQNPAPACLAASEQTVSQGPVAQEPGLHS